jgi:hypothetical protein
MGQKIYKALFTSTTSVVPITEESQEAQVAPEVIEAQVAKSSEAKAKAKDKYQEVLKGILKDY